MSQYYSHAVSGEKQASDGASAESKIHALVERVLAGQRDVFEDIVFLYRDQVYATTWQLTRNADDSMDVAQEVFIRAYRSLSSFKGKSRFSTWLHRIILNTCVDYIRREKRHRANRIDFNDPRDKDHDQATSAMESESAIDPNQREMIYQSQIQKQVLEALTHLSGRQRDVFVLRYYQDLELKEIAEALRCSEGAIKRHLHRCHCRLKELLRDLKP